MKKFSTRAALVPLLSGLLLSPLAMAQSTDDGMDESERAIMEEQGEEFESAQLEQFADAYVEVGEIHNEYSQLLQEVDSTEQAQELQQEANDEMVQAIQDSGLEVQEYSAIAAALERDPEMRQEVVSMIESRQ